MWSPWYLMLGDKPRKIECRITQGFNRSTNSNTQTFQQVSLLEGLNLARKQNLDKKWATFFYEADIPFNVVRHPTFIKVVKATSESQTYYTIIPWIVYIFVKAI